MANTYVDIEDQFIIKSDDDLIVETIIGNAQAGSTTYFLEDEIIGSSSMSNLGSGSSLHGKTLFISSVCRDIRTETNWISLILKIAGKEFGPYSRKVKADLDTVTYSIQIDLI